MISYWFWNGTPNAGDYFGEFLLKKLYTDELKFSAHSPDIVLVGSVLPCRQLKDAKFIIGAGMHNISAFPNRNETSYLAVRGRLSLNELIRLKIVSEQYSRLIKLVDPGLMLSHFFKNKQLTKKYKIGIIAHYVDVLQLTQTHGKDSTVKVISMASNDISRLVDEIVQCEVICSSSLHGIIFAHSLGIPAYHILNKPLAGVLSLKFKDYLSSFNNKHYLLFKCTNGVVPIESILKFDKDNRCDCTPTQEEIILKLAEFLSILPFRSKLQVCQDV